MSSIKNGVKGDVDASPEDWCVVLTLPPLFSNNGQTGQNGQNVEKIELKII